MSLQKVRIFYLLVMHKEIQTLYFITTKNWNYAHTHGASRYKDRT